MKVEVIEDMLIIYPENDEELDKIRHFTNLAFSVQEQGLKISLGELRDNESNFIGFYLEVQNAEVVK